LPWCLGGGYLGAALSWKAILSFNATEMGLPSFAALPVEWAIGARIDADWNAADALRHTGDFHLPSCSSTAPSHICVSSPMAPL
jgi:hypothetical protein